ncbi:MAG: Pimeloyl-ACP methyl ester carboxylesterase [Chitinophagaceae bacterium]|nr:Pimeloyl-ACP methyl ester carboxylesterase [Chitinophagaceae bacterium]
MIKICGYKNIFCCFLFSWLAAGNLGAQTDSGSFFTSFDGIKIHYQAAGNGQPVILIHGFTGNGESWKTTVLYTDLLRAGYKVITLDLRGNGLSDKPHTPEAYQHDAEAKDIMKLTSELHIKKYNALGYSRGSIILARLLVLDKKLDKAVIGGMGSDFTNPEWPRRIMFYHALMGDSVKELEPLVKSIKDRGLDQLALAYSQNGQPSTSKEELGKIKNPVLVLCGDKDSDNGSAKDLSLLLPNAVYKTVPGVHNTTHQSKEFSAEVISFFAKK